MLKKGKCKHFTGIQNKTCEAGVEYEDVSPIPCIDRLRDGSGTCDKWEEPTDDEVAEDQAKMDAVMERHRKAGPVLMELRKKHKGKSWAGVIDCPVCGGRLHISIAGYNGHMHGRCETAGCLAWME